MGGEGRTWDCDLIRTFVLESSYSSESFWLCVLCSCIDYCPSFSVRGKRVLFLPSGAAGWRLKSSDIIGTTAHSQIPEVFKKQQPSLTQREMEEVQSVSSINHNSLGTQTPDSQPLWLSNCTAGQRF